MVNNIGANSLQKYGQEYIDGCRESNLRVDKVSGNGDGKLQANELAFEITSIFLSDKNTAQAGVDLYAKIENIASKYALDDGAISAEAKAELINSKEWNEMLVEYRSLRDERKYLQKFEGLNVNMDAARGYYSEAQEAMANVDKISGDGDGEVNAKEYFTHIWDLYKDLFQNDLTKIFKSFSIARQQEEIMAKYAGKDGVLSASEYMEGLNSAEYGETLKAYRELLGEG